MSKRRNKRINETTKEFNAGVINVAAQAAMESVPDEELFTIDRQGSKSSKRKLTKQREAKEITKTESKVEQKLIKRTLTNRKEGVESKRLPKGESLSDLWGDLGVEDEKPSKKAKQSSTAKPPKVLPGQSYNPSLEAHQDALAKATALEVKKAAEIAAKEKDNTLAAFRRVEETVVDTNFQGDFSEDEDDSDDDADDDGEDGEGGTRKSKQSKAKTTAQKNRKRERNVVLNMEQKAKVEQKFLNSLNTVPDILSKMDKRAKRAAKAKELAEATKKVVDEENRRALSYDEAGNIPLSDELGGSLRTIIPKGVAVRERVARMRDDGQLIEKRKKGIRKTDRSHHKSSNVIWHPKYKLPRTAPV